VFAHACNLGVEGIVSKRLDAPIDRGRTRHGSSNPAGIAVQRERELK
jgi:hypothetical protein